jgi:hypothetical protein
MLVEEEHRMRKTVLYNHGGFVAHVSVKIDTQDAFVAFVSAADLAWEQGGQVERLYDDTRSRVAVGGVERAGLVLEFGTLDDDAELEAAKRKAEIEGAAARANLDHLRSVAGHVLKHGKLGKQSAQRLRDALSTTDAKQPSPSSTGSGSSAGVSE